MGPDEVVGPAGPPEVEAPVSVVAAAALMAVAAASPADAAAAALASEGAAARLAFRSAAWVAEAVAASVCLPQAAAKAPSFRATPSRVPPRRPARFEPLAASMAQLPGWLPLAVFLPAPRRAASAQAPTA